MQAGQRIGISRKRRKSGQKERLEWFYGYLFTAPLMLGVTIFFLIPILFTLYMSFTNWSGLSPGAWVGLENFTTIAGDGKVGRELLNTLYFAVGTVPVGMALSVVIANMLGKNRKGSSVYTTLYFLSNVTMPAAVALVWAWMFHSKYGIINGILKAFGLSGIMWMGDPRFIMPAMIIVSIWMGLGYNIIMLLAGLKNIPVTYYEAASLDGASEWKQFIKITVPLLSPYIFFLMVMSLMGAFKAFDLVYMFSSTQPYGELIDASRTMVYGIYQKGFSFYQMGYASAEAVVLFVLIAIMTAVQFWAQKKWVFYE